MSRNYELMQQMESSREPSFSRRSPSTAGAVNEMDNFRDRVSTATDRSEDDVTREESQKLVQSIFLLERESMPRMVVFAGIDSGSGCSSICASAARTLANLKLGSVCLVDGNLRVPSLPDHFGVGNHFGLTDALESENGIREFAKIVGPGNLWLLSAGSMAGESTCLLNSGLAKTRFDELRREFDYVLVDAPSLKRYSDGVALGQMADGMVLILEANETRREAASKVTDTLRASQIKILGAVLNKRTYPIPESLYRFL
jgi:protein-tyrosine kinase